VQKPELECGSRLNHQFSTISYSQLIRGPLFAPERFDPRELEPSRAFSGVAAIILPLGHALMAEPVGSMSPLAQYLLFVGWGWGQQRRSSACAITACTVLSHGLPRFATG
jgi:hypothetical protein